MFKKKFNINNVSIEVRKRELTYSTVWQYRFNWDACKYTDEFYILDEISGGALSAEYSYTFPTKERALKEATELLNKLKEVDTSEYEWHEA